MEVELRKKELGEILKAERAKQDLSIEDIHSNTKIQARFIKALESGNYQVIPSQIAGIGFIRLYARLLEINPEPLVLEYRQKTSSIPAPEASAAKRDEVKALPMITDPRAKLAVTGIAVLLALFLAALVLKMILG